MPVVALIPAVAAVSGVSAAIGLGIAEAIGVGAISSVAATAIGTGVIAGGITAAEGGDAGDVLQSAILGGAGSYIGGSIGEAIFGGSGSASAAAAANATSDPIAAMNAIQGWTTSDIGYLQSIGASSAIIQAAEANNAALANGARPATPPTQASIDMANATSDPVAALNAAEGWTTSSLDHLYSTGASPELLKLAAQNNVALGQALGTTDNNILKFIDLPPETQKYLLDRGAAPNTNLFSMEFNEAGQLLKDVNIVRGNELMWNGQMDMATGQYYDIYGDPIAPPWQPDTGTSVVTADGQVVMNDAIAKGQPVTPAAVAQPVPAPEVVPVPAPTYEIPANIQESVFDTAGTSPGSYASDTGPVLTVPTAPEGAIVETPTYTVPSNIQESVFDTAGTSPGSYASGDVTPTYTIPSNIQESVFDPTGTSPGSYAAGAGGAPVVDAAPSIPGTNNPYGNADIPLTDAAKDYLGAISTNLGTTGTAAAILGGAALAGGLLNPQPTSGPKGWSTLPPLTWGDKQSLVNPGLNPGWLVNPQPYYNLPQSQPQYYWGAQPFVATADQMQPQTIPSAPAVPFGARPAYQPLNIPQFVQQYVTPQATQALAGQTTPLVPVAPR